MAWPTLLLALLVAQAAEAQINQKLCFPSATGVPGHVGPPVIDGDIRNDLGWTGAFSYEFGNGTTSPHAIVQGLRDATNVYLSVEVNNDPSFDDDDVIVLTFKQSVVEGSPIYHRLHIFPLSTGAGAQASGAPRQVKYWSSTTLNADGTVNWPGTESDAPWLDIKVKSSTGGGGQHSWYVEMRINQGERTPLYLGGGTFGMYFDIIRVDSTTSPQTAVSFQWPASASTPNPIILDATTPPVAQWGSGSTIDFGGCGGVSLAAFDIKTNNPNPYEILPNGSNVFSATVHNSSVNDSGTPVAASQVWAQFRIWNWGIPPADGSFWQLVPTTSTPGQPSGTTLPQDIPANGAVTLSTLPWGLTDKQKVDYAAHTHQCILAELSSKDPSGRTTFINRSARVNMNFGSASTFQANAEIAAIGYGKPPDGAAAHHFDINVGRDVALLGVNEKPSAVAQRQNPVARLSWLFHGIRRNGRSVIINKKTYLLGDPVGSFGVIVDHELTNQGSADGGTVQPPSLDDWKLEVAGLKPREGTGKGMRSYEVDIPEGQTVQVGVQAAVGPGTTPGPGGGSCGCHRVPFIPGMILLFALGIARRRRS